MCNSPLHSPRMAHFAAALKDILSERWMCGTRARLLQLLKKAHNDIFFLSLALFFSSFYLLINTKIYKYKHKIAGCMYFHFCVLFSCLISSVHTFAAMVQSSRKCCRDKSQKRSKAKPCSCTESEIALTMGLG